ncbi:MAG: hypothetical protein R3224_02785 [Balneolaceae bacterium]|nr:hypothetical protein [Balneolaceae bacterium]
MDTPSPPDRIAYKELPDYLSHPDVNNTIERLASTRGNGSHRYAVFTFPVPAFDPLAGLELVGRRGEFQFYWERPDQEIAFSAGEQESEIRASGSGRFRVLSFKVPDLERHTNKF